MKRATLAGALAALAMMGMAQSANADALDDIKKSGKIRIAVREYGMFQAEAVLAVTDDGCELLTHAPEAISAVPG